MKTISRHRLFRYLMTILFMITFCVGLTPSQVDAAKTNLKVHYIDVGESDCTLVQYGSHYMLIDAGDTDDSDIVLNYLKKQNVKELDYLILTHPHADHIGSAADVIKKYTIGKIIMPSVEHTTQTYEDVLKAISNKKMKITKPVVGDTYKLGKAKFTIIAPNSYDYGDNINNYSVGIKLTYKKNSFVFIGDSETEAISDILSNDINLSADVYMCGHHGSDTSTTDKLLKAVNPNYAIISVGKNSYGHPCDSVLKLLKDNKIKMYRTDESGTIVATATGSKITFNVKASEYSDSVTENKNTTNNKANSSTSGKVVYITETGTKYHKAGCRYLKDSKIEITLEEAQEEGYTACKVCNPGE